MTSKSTKSVSGSAKRQVNSWRLKKTLARKTDFRPLDDDDIKYLWVAYKTGAFKSLGEAFERDMEAHEFAVELVAFVQKNFQGAWTLLAESKRGYGPVGVVFGFFSHPDPRLSPFMIVGDIIWMPWATQRNKIETSVKFFHNIRKDIPMVEYASEEHKKFFEMLMRHGIMRRVGKTMNVYNGKEATIFETKRQ